jgi:hypothetical protein
MAANMTLALFVAIGCKRVSYMRAENERNAVQILRVQTFLILLIVLNLLGVFYFFNMYRGPELKYFFALQHLIYAFEAFGSLTVLQLLLVDVACCRRQVWDSRNAYMNLVELLTEVFVLTIEIGQLVVMLSSAHFYFPHLIFNIFYKVVNLIQKIRSFT